MNRTLIAGVFFILLASQAFAVQSTTLVSYYPPPMAAYQKVSLATNFSVTSTSTDPDTYCNPPNATAGYIFLYTANGTLYQCPSTYTGPYTTYDNTLHLASATNVPPFCEDGLVAGTSVNTIGSVIADTSGTLHVCMLTNGVPTDTIYPQQCFNSFTSYTTASGAPAAPACPSGFSQKSVLDTFKISSTTSVLSEVCCSGN